MCNATSTPEVRGRRNTPTKRTIWSKRGITMLSKKLRFPLRQNPMIFRESRVRHGRLVDIYTPATRDGARGAVVVGKNVSLLSTTRNYWKRAASEILRRDVFPNTQASVVVRVKPSVKNATYARLKDEIQSLTAGR